MVACKFRLARRLMLNELFFYVYFEWQHAQLQQQFSWKIVSCED
jgi:hypothetical protein